MVTNGLRFKTGDIIEVNSLSFPFATHYGIYFIKDGIPYVSHNAMAAGGVKIEPYIDFMKPRSTLRLMGNIPNESDEQLLQKALEIQKSKRYSTTYYSCESFAREMCNGCYIGIDQRIVFWWGVSFIIMTTLVVVSVIRGK